MIQFQSTNPGRGVKYILIAGLAGSLAGLSISFAFKPTYIARALIIPPNQGQIGLAASLGTFSALAGLASGSSSFKNPIEQYISFMQSQSVCNSIVERFNLAKEYDVEYKSEARKELLERTIFTAGKKDGLIEIEVADHVPSRSADLANAFVEELKKLSNTLAITEAKQRRIYFEERLAETKERLEDAQAKLLEGGYSPNSIQAEPRAVAESYAKLQAEFTAAQVRIQAMQSSLNEQAPEMIRQKKVIAALSAELQHAQRASVSSGSREGYVNRYRNFKYEEALFEIYARQYEMARADEAKDSGAVQYVDKAQTPDKKSRPKRVLFLLAGALTGAIVGGIFGFRPTFSPVTQRGSLR